MESNNLKRSGFDNLYADGTLAPGNSYGEDGHTVYYKDSKGNRRPTTGAAKYHFKKFGFWGKQRIDMYLYPNSFRSPEELYLTIGHELIHVGLYNLGNYGETEYSHARHEATAYSWNYDQSMLWGLSYVAKQYNYNITNIGNGNPYPYQKPTRILRPIRP
ncbi:hypothetical protein AGMMS50262_14630 [Bacteroidia bacterium]|nr:hypothetical protein AGMMS50262_14630 [Bacteroidia bacterium]